MKILFGVWLAAGLAGWIPFALAQRSVDPNAEFSNEVIVASLPGRSISALVTHRPGETKFTHAIALFPGSPGYMNLRADGGQIRFDLAGNFLVRARRHFLEEGVIAVTLDAPSDQQGSFLHGFRETSRYGEDVQGIIDAVSRKFGALEWTLVGTSEGSVSAVHAGRMLGAAVRRVVLTASLVTPTGRGRGIGVDDVRQIKVPLLWVHHRDDPCRYTRYSRVKDYAEETKTALVTVAGANGGRGDPCMAFTEHGFVGREVKTVKAIVAWIRSGNPPPDIVD